MREGAARGGDGGPQGRQKQRGRPSVGPPGASGGERRHMTDDGDSDGSLSWEDFFGHSSSSDLVPSLLGMYDALIGREPAADLVSKQGQQQNTESNPPPLHPEGRRPLSVTSIASSCCSSTSSSSSSSSAGGVGGAGDGGRRRSESCAYLASVESLGDDELSLCDEDEDQRPPRHQQQRRRGVAGAAAARPAAQGAAVSAAAATGVFGGTSLSSITGARVLWAAHHRHQLPGRRGPLLFASPTSASSASPSNGGGASSTSSGVSSSSSSSSSSSANATTTTVAPCSHISAPSLPSGPKPKYCDPNLSYMDRVVMEIAETEAIYVRDLQQVIEGYLHRWRSSEDCPIGPKQLRDLFGNIEDIYLFNSEFLGELELCGLDPVRVAKTFVKNNSGFSIYTDYCTNYPRTVSVLTELMRQDLTVRLFRERQGALQHTLPLGSYLLKPVQRILKYHLLLQNIVRNFGKESEGYRDIADALSAMTGIAHHINEMKRRHEHAIRVQEIQSLLYGWEGEDLTTFGELCAEGAFRMYGAKALRHAFLFDRMLLLTKRKEEGMLMYKAHILCSNLMLIESVPGEPLSFHVIPFDNPRLQYTLQARNLEQKREWTLQLKRVILENYNAVIPKHARQLVMELGQNRTDDEIMAEKSTPKRQHSAPEYLERRKQERRKSETGLILRNRLRRSNHKESNAGTMDGMSSKELSPAIHRRGRRAQSVSQDRSDGCSRGQVCGEHQGAETMPSAAEKVKDRFGSWRRKSEPSYLSKSGTSIGHLSIYVSPDFIERSSDSLVGVSGKEEMATDFGCVERMLEDDSRDKQLLKMDETLGSSRKSELSGEEEGEQHQQSAGEEGECRRESLEEIVGQLVMQSHHFQRILMRQHRRGASRSRHQSAREGGSATTKPPKEGSCPPPSESSVAGEGRLPPRSTSPPSNMFRAQRQAHMRALRKEQRLSMISRNSRGTHEEEFSKIHAKDYASLTLSAGKCVSRSQGDEAGSEVQSNGECINPPCSSDKYLNHYDNLLNVWESVRQVEKELKEVAARAARGSSPTSDDTSSPWVAPVEPCIPTLPAVWLKQQEGHLATHSLKSGSLPRGFQLGHHSPRGQSPSHRHTPCSNAFESASPVDSFGNNDEGYPSNLFRMERPFTIASESPGRADEIDFEDIEQYMAETGRGGGGMSSFLSPRFPLPPLLDADGSQDGGGGGCVDDEDDEDEEDDGEGNSSTVAQINVHPDYRIYRPSVSRAALKHVISSVSNKLANLRVSATPGGVTTEDEEEGAGGSEGGQNRGRSRRRIGSSCPNSLNSKHACSTSGGLAMSGDSESEAGKGGGGGSWLVYTLARHYSRSLKERIRSIMTMNAANGTANSSNHGQDVAESSLRGGEESDGVSLAPEHFNSQDCLHQTLNRSSPTKSVTPPPVTYHKQGSSSLGARIAHGADVPEYATPQVCGVRGKAVGAREDISSRPDSLLSATSSAFTSSSDGDNKTLNGLQSTGSTQVERASVPISNILMNAEDDDDDDEYGGGSGDSYYERSFEAIESVVTESNVGCAAVGDTFRDSAIFSDHEEIDVIVGRASDLHTMSTISPQPLHMAVTRSASLRSKIPPPVPAKPKVSSVAVATSFTYSINSSNQGDRVAIPSGAPDRHQAPSQSVVEISGVKSVRERRRELEMWRSCVDVSLGDCEGEHAWRQDVDSTGKGKGGCTPEDAGLHPNSEAIEEGAPTPKGWVRHVIGKLQGD